MPGKRRILKRLEKKIKNQNKAGKGLGNWEKKTGDKVDPILATSIESMKRLRSQWKSDENERELGEEGTFTNEGDVESEEESGQEPYPEIEEYMKKEDEDDEDKL